jgi:hypothetical protein
MQSQNVAFGGQKQLQHTFCCHITHTLITSKNGLARALSYANIFVNLMASMNQIFWISLNSHLVCQDQTIFD